MTACTTNVFKALDAITAGDRPLVGGKAYNCALLKQAGFPVPDGFVVPPDASDDEIQGLVEAEWLDQQPADALFAVRSSGVAEDGEGDSFAGIHETLLNVKRSGVVEAVRYCRESVHTEQARAYRAARHLSDADARIAVFVQCMVPAVRSGVTFTVNPVTGADEIVVNTVDGLGEALVSGLVNPEEQILAKTNTSELTRLFVGIEMFYGVPQDIEWCFDGLKYWIVQARPITTRRPQPAAAETSPAGAGIEWTRANLAEILPDQTSPQALEFYKWLLNQAEREFFGNLLAPESEVGPVMKVFHGRPYFNLAQFRYSTGLAGLAFADVLRSLGHAERIQPEDEIKPKPSLGKLLSVLPDIARLAIYDIRMKHVLEQHEARTAAGLARLSADPATLSDRDIWAAIQWWMDQGPEAMVPVFVMSSVQFRESVIRKACLRAGVPYEDLAYSHLAAGKRSVSSQQAFDVVALSDIARSDARAAAYLQANDGTFADFCLALAGTPFLAAFQEFLSKYGHRGRYETDWAIPRMHENPAPVLFAVREQLNSATRQDPEAAARRQAEDAALAWRRFESRLTRWQKLTLLPRVRMTLRQLKQQYVWREQVRSDVTKVMSALRRWHLELANRFVQRGWLDRRDDYFLLFLEEVKAACHNPETGAGLRDIAVTREAERAAERDLAMPFFMREAELPALLRAPSSAVPEGSALTGLCVSPGTVEAEVVVLRDPSEFATMKRGAILVAPATDPSWTPLFTLASGVIVEVGGMLSHASTIAREYGLPALANVKHATRTLRTGERVRLEASGGRVIQL